MLDKNLSDLVITDIGMWLNLIKKLLTYNNVTFLLSSKVKHPQMIKRKTQIFVFLFAYCQKIIAC